MVEKPEEIGEKEGGLLAGVVCIATIGLALWGCKKISESARGQSLTWGEFLFPAQEDQH
ncbi:MAG: hypothetical protein ACWGNI_00995 [Desulfobacterales bacterium]